MGGGIKRRGKEDWVEWSGVEWSGGEEGVFEVGVVCVDGCAQENDTGRAVRRESGRVIEG